MTVDEINEILKSLRPGADFDGSPDFISDGLLDSLDIIQLTAILQERYKVDISPLEILPENFCSFEALVELVKNSPSV